MLSPRQSSRRRARQRALEAEVHATLEAAFVPSRAVLPWNGGRYRLPGFQTLSRDAHVLVRYVHAPSVSRQTRRRIAIAMLKRYQAALIAGGWSAQLVDEPGKAPHIICVDKEPAPVTTESAAETL